MASCAPACCICCAMAQAMLRLLATPNTATVRPCKLCDTVMILHDGIESMRIAAEGRNVLPTEKHRLSSCLQRRPNFATEFTGFRFHPPSVGHILATTY